MRDLKAILDELNGTECEIIHCSKGEYLEAVERAIKAEELIPNLQDTIQKMIDQDVEWHCEFGRLREENDLQRQSIQNLSGQVVNTQETFKKLLKTLDGDRLTDKQMEAITDAINILSSPDPGAKVKAVVEAAKKLIKERGEYGISWTYLMKLKQALADLEGGTSL